jgi:sugar phosphate isomerase/epimerase
VGGDIATELQRFAGRITPIHAKEAAPLGTAEEDGCTALGDGVIGWPGLLSQIMATGAVLAVVEHDEPADWQYVAKRRRQAIIRQLSALFDVTARRR